MAGHWIYRVLTGHGEAFENNVIGAVTMGWETVGGISTFTNPLGYVHHSILTRREYATDGSGPVPLNPPAPPRRPGISPPPARPPQPPRVAAPMPTPLYKHEFRPVAPTVMEMVSALRSAGQPLKLSANPPAEELAYMGVELAMAISRANPSVLVDVVRASAPAPATPEPAPGPITEKSDNPPRCASDEL